MIKKQLKHDQSVRLGCDPEFFFKKKGKIVGAEKVLPKNGLMAGGGKIIIDGVQAELNPEAETCRVLLGTNIAMQFAHIQKKLNKDGKLGYDFSPVVEVEKKEFNALSDNSKKFGCAPSLNSHANGSVVKIEVDPMKYKKRPAGGHIHLGHLYDDGAVFEALKQPERVIPVLDIILGNTAVLIDRDSGNVERRKSYGRAGEYRTPPHGLEYRTLSNFWLYSYPLMSLVTGLARQAVLMVSQSDAENDYVKEIMSRVKPDEIARAINENDFELAMKNFKAIKPVLMRITPLNDGFPINRMNIKEFMHFVKKGKEYWWKNDPMANWDKFLNTDEPCSEASGFNEFLTRYVRADMRKTKKK